MQKLPLEPVSAITFDLYGTLMDLEASFSTSSRSTTTWMTWSNW
ncbi:MAG: hypothetical protein O3A93_09775 [Chloroflexi bacterium]|nr:hypothetical protein [Chloroflexota bacterium]MDA1271533.1 hypothetical protein [Chloroflexota bacterium]